jgi:hypothetical protein
MIFILTISAGLLTGTAANALDIFGSFTSPAASLRQPLRFPSLRSLPPEKPYDFLGSGSITGWQSVDSEDFCNSAPRAWEPEDLGAAGLYIKYPKGKAPLPSQSSCP